jgi:putative endonuclease
MQERIYCIYIVASRSHTLYIGVSGNLLKRVFEHKQRAHPGFSAKYNCNRLV